MLIQILIYTGKNILTGEVIEKVGTTGNVRERDGFVKSDRNVFIWKDPGTQKIYLLKHIGYESGINNGYDEIKLMCISDLFNGVALSSCKKFMKTNWSLGVKRGTGGSEYKLHEYPYCIGNNRLWMWTDTVHWAELKTEPATGDWNAGSKSYASPTKGNDHVRVLVGSGIGGSGRKTGTKAHHIEIVGWFMLKTMIGETVLL